MAENKPGKEQLMVASTINGTTDIAKNVLGEVPNIAKKLKDAQKYEISEANHFNKANYALANTAKAEAKAEAEAQPTVPTRGKTL